MIRILKAVVIALALSVSVGTAAGVSAQISLSGEPGAKVFTVKLNEGQFLRLDRPASSVFIANAEIADVNAKSNRMVYVFGKKPGQTTIYALDKADNVIANIEVVVEHNIERLKGILSRLAPAGGLSVESIDGGMVLSGTVATAVEAENIRRIAQRFVAANEELINLIAVTESNQVNLRVRVAEVSRDILNRFGFNWDALYNASDSFLLGFQTFNPTLESANFLSSAYSGTDLDVNGLVDALADDGLITILAEPNLTALNGETASFLAGGEFPIPISQDEDTITVAFKEFGVSLSFTPTLIGNSRINLHVRPEVSQLTTAGSVTLSNIAIPGLTVRRAETTIELASGQSFAIAGLLLDNSQELIKSTPGLGDIPILGALFKSERFERNETELIIIVTPYLVRPVDGDKIATPIDPYLAEPTTQAQVGTTAQNANSNPQVAEQPAAAGGSGYTLD